MSDTAILQDERLSDDSPDLEDNETTFANPNKDKDRKGDHDRKLATSKWQFFKRFQYSRLNVYTSKGKHLLQQFEILTAIDRIPLPFTKRDWQPGEEWIQGALLCTWGSGAILLLNVILTLIAVGIGYSKSHSDKQSDYAELYKGDCSIANGWTTGMHIIINVLSTALLAASNYVMQCLSAPTREDVNKAHIQRNWVDIGTFSIRNFGIMDTKRKVLWILLFMSSFPIHMMYNSAVFPSITTKDYGVLIIPDDLQQTESLFPNDQTAEALPNYLGYTFNELQDEIFNDTFDNWPVSKCLSKYNKEYNTDRGTLLLIADREHFHNTSVLRDTDWSQASFNNWVYNFEYYEKEKWEQSNLSVNASHLSYPNWTFRSPGIQDDFDQLYDLNYVMRGMNGSFAKDAATLSRYITTHNPTGRQLDEYLTASSHWANSSWAAQISFHMEGYERYETPSGYYYTDQKSFSVPISRCMSKEATQECQFYFSLPICAAVIACNSIKVVCMYLTARTSRRNIFLTVGDGLASFLNEPDPTTKDRCFLSSSGVTGELSLWKLAFRRVLNWVRKLHYTEHSETAEMVSLDYLTTPTHSPPETYSGRLPRRRRWFQSASWRRWAVTLWLFLSCLATSWYLLFLGTNSMLIGAFSNIQALGFGKPSGSTVILPGSDVIVFVLLANAPQLVFSALYYLCNGLLTCMLVVAEYNDFATQRKPLRVSWPKGEQRSTYYLSVPYRYSLPMIIASAVLHWLLSQSIFLVKINALDVHGIPDGQESVTACGYSPLAMFITIIVGMTALLVLVGLSLRRMQSNMPLASYCSAAISASCHPFDDKDASLKPVMWGEVPRSSGYCQNEGSPVNSVRHDIEWEAGNYAYCTFTSKETITPSMVRLYS